MTEKELYAQTLAAYEAGPQHTERKYDDDDGETIIRGEDHVTLQPVSSTEIDTLHDEVVQFLTEEAKQLAL